MAKKPKSSPGHPTVLTPLEIEDYKSGMLAEAQAAYASKNIPRAFDLLDIPSKSKTLKITSESDYISLIREGLPFQSLESIINYTSLSPEEISSILHISGRTLRRYTPDTIFNPEQSERLIELARLYSRGEEVFDTLSSFKQWMDSPIRAFGDIKPKTFLDTSMGIDMIMDELGRIEHGVFA